MSQPDRTRDPENIEPTPVRSSLDLPPDVAAPLLGATDENLIALESALAADIHVRGNTVTLSGSPADVALAERVFGELVTIVRRGQTLGPDAVRRTVGMLTQGLSESPADVLSLDILSRRGKTIRPKTLNQKRYVDAIDSHTIVFGIGPAGTGKTYLAMAKAVQALQTKQVNRIILTRPAVEAGERLGFLPGTLHEKIDPYLRPLHDALHDMMDPEAIPKLMQAGVIEVAPLAYMRGRTLNDAFIILDEAQNTTAEQMKMFLTRLGFGAKIVVTGDVTQIDLPGGARSGLAAATEILEGIDDIHFARLDSSDVVRHRLVSDIVDAYGRFEATREDGIRPGQPRPAPRRIAAAGAAPVTAAPPPVQSVVQKAAVPEGRSEEGSTPMSIEISNESGMDVSEEDLLDVARFVIARMDVHPAAELSMVLVDSDTMADLHMRWMDLPGPTDVMSFPMDELEPGGRPDAPEPGPAMLGDIVLCPPFAAEQAEKAGHPVAHELALLTVHGMLHLLGYDHAEPDEEKEMFALQNQLLTEWYEELRRAEEEARLAERDRSLLGKAGFVDTPES